MILRLSFTILLTLLFLSYGESQVLFLETFDEAENATTGTSNDAGMVVWSTLTPGSVAVNDYFKVVSGQLEAQDTNVPAATWTTGAIALNGCSGLEVSIMLSEVSNLEECTSCPDADGTLCIDWVKMEYRLDGGSWLEFSGETCDLTQSPGEMIQIGDIPSGGPIEISRPLCELTANALELRISCVNWATAEQWSIDDVAVTCSDCTIFPVELNKFKAESQGKTVELNWETATESGSSHFEVQRSQAGGEWTEIARVSAAGTNTTTSNYSIVDESPLSGITNYRLKLVDMDGTFSFSAISSVERSLAEEELIFFPNPVIDFLTVRGELLRTNKVEIYDLNSKRMAINYHSVASDEASIRIDLRHLKPGVYLVKVGEILKRIRK
jgi:hypothetical protein